MIRLRDMIEQKYHFPSVPALKARFWLPEIYFVSSIYDFLEHKAEIKPTGFRLFSYNTRNHTQLALIYFSDCFYRALHEPLTGKELVDNFKVLSDTKTLPSQNKAIVQEKINCARDKLYNSLIYDQTGSFRLYHSSPEEINQKSRLNTVVVLYHPHKDFLKLHASFTYSDELAATLREPTSVLEGIIRLQPSY